MKVMYVANCIALDGAHKSELFMVEHTFSSFDFALKILSTPVILMF
jgi:hypothetical protein